MSNDLTPRNESESGGEQPEPNDDLLPCPLCGGAARYVGAARRGYRVECTRCLARSGWGDYGYQVEALWNKCAGRAAAASPTSERHRKSPEDVIASSRAHDDTEFIDSCDHSPTGFAFWRPATGSNSACCTCRVAPIEAIEDALSALRAALTAKDARIAELEAALEMPPKFHYSDHVAALNCDAMGDQSEWDCRGHNIFDLARQADAEIARKDARISALETMLGELVRSFNPEPASPPLTQWDRAAAVLGGVPTQSPSEIRAEYEIARLRDALTLFDAAISEAEAILGGEYSLHYGPFFDNVCAARAALRQEPAPSSQGGGDKNSM